MFDSIFDNIFILIPLAIIIGRIVLQARKKHDQKSNPAHKPKPQPPRLHIPVHFEDDVEESDGGTVMKVKRRVPPAPQRRTPAPLFPEERKTSSGLQSQGAYNAYAGDRESIAAPVSRAVPPAISVPGTLSPAQNNFPAGLKNLSPLKQAVVMAEVLGLPKSLQ